MIEWDIDQIDYKSVISQFRYKQSLQYKHSVAMQDKNTLINSMNNLINHISISRKNQEEMFASLSRKDFDKIISNLEDSLQKLRITTVKLLTELLYNNSGLKSRFCELMNIHFSLNSNIVLNTNLNKMLQRYPTKVAELFMLLKQTRPISNAASRSKTPLLWFINLKSDRLTVEYIQREDFTTMSNYTISKGSKLDPLDCIFGISVYPREIEEEESRVATSSSIMSDSKTRDTARSNQTASIHTFSNGPVFHMPVSTKNASFQKPVSRVSQNSSFSYSQAPNQNQFHAFGQVYPDQKVPYREVHKISLKSQQHVPYTNGNPLQQHQPSYMNSNGIQQHHHPAQQNLYCSTSKKENEEKYYVGEKDRNNNRLSLQFNDFKGHRKVNTFDGNDSFGNQSQILRIEETHPNEHHHGIQLTTPRHSLRNTHKISIVNGGCQTERANTQKPTSFAAYQEREKLNELNQITSNNQRLKTIHLGKGARGAETARQKKSLRIQRH